MGPTQDKKFIISKCYTNHYLSIFKGMHSKANVRLLFIVYLFVELKLYLSLLNLRAQEQERSCEVLSASRVYSREIKRILPAPCSAGYRNNLPEHLLPYWVLRKQRHRRTRVPGGEMVPRARVSVEISVSSAEEESAFFPSGHIPAAEYQVVHVLPFLCHAPG